MYLGKKHIHGNSISPIMVDLPRKIEASELQALVIKLKQNDPADIQDVILKIYEGHIRLAINLCSRYMKFVPISYKDDLIGQALYGLLYAIKKAQTNLRDNEITPYIVTWIHKAISSYITKQKRFPILDEQILYETLAKGDLEEHYDLEELIGKCITTLQEKDIYNLSKHGYNTSQIARLLGVSKQRISKIRKDLAKRVRRKLSE